MGEEKTKTDVALMVIQKLLGMIMLSYLVWHHVNVRPISYPIFALPLTLIGIDITKILKR